MIMGSQKHASVSEFYEKNLAKEIGRNQMHKEGREAP